MMAKHWASDEERRAYHREYMRTYDRRKPKRRRVDVSREPYGVSPEFKRFSQVRFTT